MSIFGKLKNLSLYFERMQKKKKKLQNETKIEIVGTIRCKDKAFLKNFGGARTIKRSNDRINLIADFVFLSV